MVSREKAAGTAPENKMLGPAPENKVGAPVHEVGKTKRKYRRRIKRNK